MFLKIYTPRLVGFPSGSVVKNACCAGDIRCTFNPWVRKILWRMEGMVTHSSILEGKISWTEEPHKATVHGITKSQIWLTQLSTHAHTPKLIRSKDSLLLALYAVTIIVSISSSCQGQSQCIHPEPWKLHFQMHNIFGSSATVILFEGHISQAYFPF